MKRKRKEELDAKWKKVATEAVTNDDFKDRLVKDPVSCMSEFGIALPEGIVPKLGTGGILRLTHSSDISDEIKAEALWWKWRLDIIREFGREEVEREIIVAPETEDGV